MDWAHRAESQLRSIYADPAVAEGLFTPRFWRIAEGAVLDRMGQLVSAEIMLQVERLMSLVEQLRTYTQWGDRPGAIVVVDTNILLHYQRIDLIRWSQVVGESQVRLVIPLLVLDELDDKRYLGSERIRERARSATAPLDERHAEVAELGFAQLTDSTTLEYLLDEDGHGRRSNPDEELLDRAEFLHVIAGRPVNLVTADRGLRVRAAAGRTGVRPLLMPEEWARDRANSDPTDRGPS